MKINTSRQYNICWKIIELMDRINLIVPDTYTYKEMEIYYSAISIYNQARVTTKGGHAYGERL